MDAYFDESTKFRSSAMRFPCKIKNADNIAGDKNAKIAELKQQIDEIEGFLRKNPFEAGKLSAVLNFYSFARFYLQNMLMMKGHEMAFPKSFYATMKRDEASLDRTLCKKLWRCHKDVFGAARKTCDSEVKFVRKTLQKRFERMDGKIKKM